MKAPQPAAPPQTTEPQILDRLPPSTDVREEVRVTSHRMRLLLELLGVCEKAEQHLPPPRSSS